MLWRTTLYLPLALLRLALIAAIVYGFLWLYLKGISHAKVGNWLNAVLFSSAIVIQAVGGCCLHRRYRRHQIGDQQDKHYSVGVLI